MSYWVALFYLIGSLFFVVGSAFEMNSKLSPVQVGGVRQTNPGSSNVGVFVRVWSVLESIVLIVYYLLLA